MYQILERGSVSSIVEQEKNHGTRNRTHFKEQFKEKETHDVCFEVDRVYGNFSTDERFMGTQLNSKFRADVILLFSENNILDRRQFVDMDGRHVFDEKYSGDTEKSPGFSVDLLKTPFMILVSEAEKDKLVAFLKEKSVFRVQLKQLKPEELETWLNEHLIITSSIDDFRFTEEVKSRFFQSTKLQPRKGYVELTDTEAGFKVDSRKTKQFFALAA